MSKKNLIIFEGVDGVGKTTLVKVLNKKLKYSTKHFGPVKTKQEGQELYFKFIKNELIYPTNDQNWLLDRFAGGEFTYSKVYREYDSYDYLDTLEKTMQERFNVLLVLVTAPEDIVKKRLIERGENFLKMEDFNKIYDLFEKYYFMSNLPKMRIDTSIGNKYENAQKIIDKLRSQY